MLHVLRAVAAVMETARGNDVRAFDGTPTSTRTAPNHHVIEAHCPLRHARDRARAPHAADVENSTSSTPSRTLLADAVARRAAEQELRIKRGYDPLPGCQPLLFVGTVPALSRSCAPRTSDDRAVSRCRRVQARDDSLGHAMGDELLQELARRLGAALRSNDTIRPVRR